MLLLKIKNKIGMKKSQNNITLFGISVFLFCTSLALAQSSGISFEKTKWNRVLEKAKKEKKMIFLDCYTSWCGPCKWMEKNVYNNDAVADFYNANFICMKMDMEKDEGFSLAKKYNINAYPSLLYLTATGEVLHRFCGAAKVKDFIKIGQDALNPQKQLATYTNLYNCDITDSRIAYLYFELLEKACLMSKDTVNKYFAAQKADNLTSPDNWKLIYRYATDYASKPFQYLESNKTVFSKLYNKDSVETLLNFVYANELQQARLKRNGKKFGILKTKFLKLKTKDAEKIIQHAEQKLVKLPNADMKNAIEIQDSIVGPVNVSKGYGALREFRESSFIEESNSAWFKLNINHDTILTFDIVPIDNLDDYDFAIFKCPDGNCINDIRSNKIKPDRCCYSYCISKEGVTGLSRYTTNTNIGAGSGPAYVSGIPVKAGETYYLLVDFAENYIRDGQQPLGFTIYFYNYWPKRKPIVLNNVFFENNKAVLPKESFSELDKLIARLNKNQMKIEIRGHSDGKGDEQKNQALSEERAKAVVDYLISKNIKPDRLFYKGFGSSKPIASNETEEGRKKNRRVEFVIVMN